MKQPSQRLTDKEVVMGLSKRERSVEEWFYRSARRYFNEHFNQIFFDADSKQEIFQQSFLKLWMEIDNGRIRLIDNTICRQQANGQYLAMTCSLTTFLISFARTEYREMVRNKKEDNWPELPDTINHQEPHALPMEDSVEEIKNRVVDSCIQQMPPRCLDILTMFYYKGMNLDQILEARQEHNSSKNGLKTAKNKCMNTLREKIAAEFEKLNLKI